MSGARDDSFLSGSQAAVELQARCDQGEQPHRGKTFRSRRNTRKQQIKRHQNVFSKNRQQVRAIGDFLIAKLLKILEDNSRLNCNSFSAATLKTAADVPAPGFLCGNCHSEEVQVTVHHV